MYSKTFDDSSHCSLFMILIIFQDHFYVPKSLTVRNQHLRNFLTDSSICQSSLYKNCWLSWEWHKLVGKLSWHDTLVVLGLTWMSAESVTIATDRYPMMHLTGCDSQNAPWLPHDLAPCRLTVYACIQACGLLQNWPHGHTSTYFFNYTGHTLHVIDHVMK